MDDEGLLSNGFAEYLEEKHISDVLRALFTAISVERPDDVLGFLCEQTAVLQTFDPEEEIEWLVWGRTIVSAQPPPITHVWCPHIA